MSAEDFDEGGSTQLGYLLADPWGLVRRRWPAMLATLALGVATVLAGVIFLVPVRYEAEASVLIASQRIPEEFVRSTVRDEPFEKINAMIGEILSREKLTRLVEEHDLYAEMRKKKPMNDVVTRMRRDITIQPEFGVGQEAFHGETARLYRVAFLEQRPEVAAAVTNELASLLTTINIRMRTQQARLTSEFLRRELTRAEEELRKQQGKITEFKERHPGALPGDLEATTRRLESLQRQRQSLALQLAESEARLAAMASGPLGRPDPSTPAGRLVALRSSLAEQMATHTDAHPNVVSLRRQVTALEKQLRIAPGDDPGASGSLVRAASRTVSELRRQLAATDVALQEMHVQVGKTPALQEELAALEERSTVQREKYLEFLRKVEEAELAETLESAQQGERVSVLDRAAVPSTPEKSRLKYLLAGLAASLALAVGLAILLELGDPVLTSAGQIESEFGVSVLGSVPRTR